MSLEIFAIAARATGKIEEFRRASDAATALSEAGNHADPQLFEAVPTGWHERKRPDPPSGMRWVVRGGVIGAEPIPATRRETLRAKLQAGTDLTPAEIREALLEALK